MGEWTDEDKEGWEEEEGTIDGSWKDGWRDCSVMFPSLWSDSTGFWHITVYSSSSQQVRDLNSMIWSQQTLYFKATAFLVLQHFTQLTPWSKPLRRMLLNIVSTAVLLEHEDTARTQHLFVLPAFILHFFIIAHITVSFLDSSVLVLDRVSLWIKESAKWINVNVNPDANVNVDVKCKQNGHV